MIQLKPYKPVSEKCKCGSNFIFEDILWQGLHVCEKSVCSGCGMTRILSLPVNQSLLEQYVYYPGEKRLFNMNDEEVKQNWFSSKLTAITEPDDSPVKVNIEVFEKHDEVVILNTLDYIYGHSLLFLLNLQRLIKSPGSPGIVVIIQPMMRWLVPEEGVAEIWTVDLGFRDFNRYHSRLSGRINDELKRFGRAWLSSGHPLPTRENINIERFTGIKPFDFNIQQAPRITFIWREDPDRLWIRNIFLLKVFKKLHISAILFPFHLLRVSRYFRMIRRKLGSRYRFTAAGLGNSGSLPSFVDDRRTRSFDEDTERALCTIYSESILVIGVHGSSMILPSAHAGMAVSLMPSRRWGNFAEDILYTEEDVRLSAFQRRIIPLNLNLCDVRDITADMIIGRDYFLKKFNHSEDL